MIEWVGDDGGAVDTEEREFVEGWNECEVVAAEVVEVVGVGGSEG